MQKKLNIYLAGPRGFCAGVDRAIEMVKGALKKYGSPVYVRHEIVHNKFVVENLKSQGAIFVEELDEIKDKSRPVIFSAHGVPKAVPEEAVNLNLIYYDATCPLVSKIHKEVENFDKKNFPVILIGHRNHPEVIGTMGQTNNEVHLVEKGETLYSISKIYNVDVEKIKKLNNLSSNEISIGQKIIVDDQIEEIEESSQDIVTSRVEGFASSINGSDDSDKYLALHKSAEVGTIIFVKNQMNGNIVIVRVIGKLPNTGVNNKIDIRLSSIAYEKLNAQDDIIPVELTYVGKEIK